MSIVLEISVWLIVHNKLELIKTFRPSLVFNVTLGNTNLHINYFLFHNILNNLKFVLFLGTL